MENYLDFVQHKSERAVHTDSITVSVDDLNPNLYSFQRDIVRWALAKGRAAIFADCGLGKTLMQLEFAHRACEDHGVHVKKTAEVDFSPLQPSKGKGSSAPKAPKKQTEEQKK